MGSRARRRAGAGDAKVARDAGRTTGRQLKIPGDRGGTGIRQDRARGEGENGRRIDLKGSYSRCRRQVAVAGLQSRRLAYRRAEEVAALPRDQSAFVDQLPVPFQKLVVVGILNPPCKPMGCPPRLRPCLAEVSRNYSKELLTGTLKKPGAQGNLALTPVSISIRPEQAKEDWDRWLKRVQSLPTCLTLPAAGRNVAARMERLTPVRCFAAPYTAGKPGHGGDGKGADFPVVADQAAA